MKKFLNYALAIILAIVITVTFSIEIVKTTILSEKYVLSKFENENFYDKIYEQAKSNFEKYIQQSGLDEEILNNIITKEKIKEDIHIIIDNLYNGTKQEIDIEGIKNNLNNNIEKTLTEKEINITEKQRESINTFVNCICKEYEDTIMHSDLETEINGYYRKIVKYIDIVKKVALVIFGIGIFTLITLNFKHVYRFVSSIGETMLISGLLLLFTNFFINSKFQINYITILNDAFSEILRNIINEIIHMIKIYGVTLLIGGIVLIILSNFSKYKKYLKKKR